MSNQESDQPIYLVVLGKDNIPSILQRLFALGCGFTGAKLNAPLVQDTSYTAEQLSALNGIIINPNGKLSLDTVRGGESDYNHLTLSPKQFFESDQKMLKHLIALSEYDKKILVEIARLKDEVFNKLNNTPLSALDDPDEVKALLTNLNKVMA